MKSAYRRIISLLSAAAAGCALLAAFPVSAAKVPVSDEMYPELRSDCVNVVAAKYQNIVQDDLESGILEYDVEIRNNAAGISDADIRLVVSPELTIVKNEKGEAITAGVLKGTFTAELDADANDLHVCWHSDQNTKTDGILFTIQVKLPDSAKDGDKYLIGPESVKLSNSAGELKSEIVSGYILYGHMHDDLSFDKGDMNMTHGVDVADAQLILKEYVKSLSGKESALREDHRLLIDIDENGKVDVADAQLLLKFCTEQTALNYVTWEQLLGKKPKYPSVHITNDTFNYVWGIGKYSKDK